MDIKQQSDIYSFMIEKSMDLVFLLDKAGKFVFLNDRVKSLLGFHKSELIDHHFSTLICPDDLVGAGCDVSDGVNLTGKELMRNFELRFRHKHGRANYRYFDVKLLYVPNEIGEACSQLILGRENHNRCVMAYGVARDVTHLKSLENILNTNANSDYLTGLPNRAILKDRMNIAIAHAKRNAYKFAVMFIDLDGFKQVNDTYSHSAGDVILQAVAVRLKDCLREADTLARVGGDEFILLLPIIHELDEVRAIVEKLLNKISEPFLINGRRIPLTASVGITLYPDNGEKFDELVTGADRAMYHIKHRAKNGYAFLSELGEANRYENILGFSLP